MQPSKNQAQTQPQAKPFNELVSGLIDSAEYTAQLFDQNPEQNKAATFECLQRITAVIRESHESTEANGNKETLSALWAHCGYTRHLIREFHDTKNESKRESVSAALHALVVRLMLEQD